MAPACTAAPEVLAPTPTSDRVCAEDCSSGCVECAGATCTKCADSLLLVDGACVSTCPSFAPLADRRAGMCLACPRGMTNRANVFGVSECIACSDDSCYQCAASDRGQCTACHFS